MPDVTHECPQGRKRLEHVAVFVNYTGDFVLVRRQKDSVSFPRVASGENALHADKVVECFSANVERLCGVKYKIFLLYSTVNATYGDHISPHRRALFEVLSPYDSETDLPSLPPSSDYEWIAKEKLFNGDEEFGDDGDYSAGLTLSRTETQSFRETVQEWEWPGWYDSIIPEVITVFKRLACSSPLICTQVQVGSEGMVLRLEVTDKVRKERRRFYLKAHASNEAKVVDCLASFAPCATRKPLHISSSGKWYMMDDYGQSLVGNMTSDDVCAFVTSFELLQRSALSKLADLRALDVPDVTYSSLASRLSVMLRDDTVLAQLRDEELEWLDECNLVDKVCSFLHLLYDHSGIVKSIVHNDLDISNIIKTGDASNSYVVIDWEKALIDLAISDVGALVVEAEELGVADVGKMEVSLMNYLRSWSTQQLSADGHRTLRDSVMTKDRLVEMADHYDYRCKQVMTPKFNWFYFPLFKSVLHSIYELEPVLKEICSTCTCEI